MPTMADSANHVTNFIFLSWIVAHLAWMAHMVAA